MLLDVLKVGRVLERGVRVVQVLHPAVQVREVLADRADVALEVGNIWRL